jgi:signal transduction histidine kinase
MSASPAGGTSGRNDILLLILGFAALVAVAAASAWQMYRAAAVNDEIVKTLIFKADLVRLLSLVQDAETGQRGYLLTADQRYLLPYETATAEIDSALKGILDRADERGVRRDRIETVKSALKVKLDELAETIAFERSGDAQAARSIVASERGREAMNALRGVVGLITARQDTLLAGRIAAADANGKLLLAIMVLGLLIAAALAWTSQSLLRRQAKKLTAARAELAHANEGLEAAVQERTAELISANAEIQRFAYIVSHDLRAPLVNVMGFTSELDAARRTLKEQIDGLDEVGAAKVSEEARLAIEEDLPEAISFIRTSTAKMDRLINAILELSREGRRNIRPESVSIEQVVGAISDTIYQQTQAADAEIEVQPGLPPLVTDRMSIEQIFQNLIENAVKYLDRSRPGRIVVSGRRVGALVEYAVEDNGRGIDAKDHERVFELFRRAGAQDQPGEGLGLAFVRASVRRLGGTIRLTSEVGKGSTFHLSFPAVLRPQSEGVAA